jgi:hypothetical protein
MSRGLHRLALEKPIYELEDRIAALEAAPLGAQQQDELKRLKREVVELTTRIFGSLDPWQTVEVARHPDRPKSSDYLSLVFDEFVELHGDRAFGDDPAMLTGFAKLDRHKVLVIGHQKGKTLAERQACHFGCAHPEGYRKALRLMKLAEKFGEKPDVCNAIGAHHDEIEMTTLLSPIIQVCDAISGARPGARREVVEAYIQRLRDLENMALENNGVSKAFAIQAGRELRVMVEADRVSDEQADALAISLASKIETEMTYPGQVRVTVIREKRAVGIAR